MIEEINMAKQLLNEIEELFKDGAYEEDIKEKAGAVQMLMESVKLSATVKGLMWVPEDEDGELSEEGDEEFSEDDYVELTDEEIKELEGEEE